MELSDLVGIHKLSGVETGQVNVTDEFGDTQDCGFVKFTLDGVHYMAVEDPDDGYRSRCRELVVSEQAPRYSFPPPRNAYPCCHFEYHPEGMACNSPVITDDDFSRILMS